MDKPDDFPYLLSSDTILFKDVKCDAIQGNLSCSDLACFADYALRTH